MRRDTNKPGDLLEREHGYPKKEGIDFLRSFGLEEYGIIVPNYYEIPGHMGYEDACVYIDEHRQEIIDFIEDGPDFREFLAIRSSGNTENPGKNTTLIVPTSPSMVFGDMSLSGSYEDVLIERIKQTIGEIYGSSEEKKLHFLLQFFGANSNKNFPQYGEENTTCILKIGFPDQHQAYLCYIDGLNAVEYNGDMPAYLFASGKTYHLPYSGDYYSGQYLEKRIRKGDTEIRQKALEFLDEGGNFTLQECDQVPESIDTSTQEKIKILIEKLREKGVVNAEIELTIVPTGEVWVYQFRRDTLRDQSGEFYTQRNRIQAAAKIRSEAIIFGHESLSEGICIGNMEANKTYGWYAGSYQVLSLIDTGKESDKDRQVQEVIRKNTGQNTLIVIGNSDSGAIERYARDTYDGIIYVGGNIASHAIGNTINMIQAGDSDSFVVITDMGKEKRDTIIQHQKRGRLAIFYNEKNGVDIFFHA